MSSPTSTTCSTNPNRLLAHPEVAKAICATLHATGLRWQDVEDGRQEVYVRALRFFRANPAATPTELENMKAFCSRVARNYALDQYRKGKLRKTDLDARCDRAGYGVVERESVPRRDPVDAERQLEVLAELFRGGEMPKDGIEILEGIASKCTLDEIGEGLGITLWAVRGRLDTMRKVFRQRMAKLGLLPSMQKCSAISGSDSISSTIEPMKEENVSISFVIDTMKAVIDWISSEIEPRLEENGSTTEVLETVIEEEVARIEEHGSILEEKVSAPYENVQRTEEKKEEQGEREQEQEEIVRVNEEIEKETEEDDSSTEEKEQETEETHAVPTGVVQ